MADLAMDEKSRDVMTAKTRAILLCSILAAMTIGGVGLVGPPRSNWLYPFAVLLGVAGCLWSFHLGDRPFPYAGDDPPKSVSEAVRAGAMMFAVFATVLYIYNSLLRPSESTPLLATFIGATVGVNAYRQKRGHEYSVWPSVVVFGGFVLFRSLQLMVN